MARNSLYLEEIYDEDFRLFSLYSKEPVYRVAFFINRHLGIFLQHSLPIENSKKKVTFPLYEYENGEIEHWFLLKNWAYAEVPAPSPTLDLFAGENTGLKKIPYLRQFKEIPYFIKITGDISLSSTEICKAFNKIHIIDYCLEIQEEIKEKKLLLF